MVPTNNCRSLTIFEGCDGSGKTTEAKRYAELTGARYVHFGAIPKVTDAALGRMYVEAMLPALQGYQDVVFDRSWLSEIPYGAVFRQGADRLKRGNQRRLLERIAMRCGAVVVFCEPGWEAVEKSFLSGRDEMLKNTRQLKAVYELYGVVETQLPEVIFDYTSDRLIDPGILMELRTPHHVVEHNTTGNLGADNVVLVDSSLYEKADSDTYLDWCASNISSTASYEVNKFMDSSNLVDTDYLFVGTDVAAKDIVAYISDKKVYAFGDEAYKFMIDNNILGKLI
jgi:thymidylate kinase